jgi:hypothetical protein
MQASVLVSASGDLRDPEPALWLGLGKIPLGDLATLEVGRIP